MPADPRKPIAYVDIDITVEPRPDPLLLCTACDCIDRLSRLERTALNRARCPWCGAEGFLPCGA